MQLELRLLRPLGPSPRAATAGASRTFDLSVNPVSGGHGARQTPSTTQRARRQSWGFGRNSKSPYPPPTKAEGRGFRSHLVWSPFRAIEAKSTWGHSSTFVF